MSCFFFQASESSSGSSLEGGAKKKGVPESEAMEHAFLDIDDLEDPAAEEWNFKGKEHTDKV